MTTCSHCNRAIKNIYLWEGRELGIECWKKLALPAILAERERKEEERTATRRAKSELIASVLASKDLSRITNRFKREFIPSIIEQVKDGRMLSNRQMELAWEMFNKADKVREYVLRLASGEKPMTGIADDDYQGGYNGKLVAAAVEMFGELPEQGVFWYDRMKEKKAYNSIVLYDRVRSEGQRAAA